MVVEIRLLGGFDVEVDGVPAPADGWRRRQAAALVKLLALAPQRTLHRERVIDALWPDLSVEEAAPRLHKAAHYARKVRLGHHRSLLLGGDAVALFPDLDVVVDVHRFDAFAARAVTANDKHLAHAALAIYGGELLPGDIYESWTHDERERLRLRHAELLRYAERWEELLADDPADEDAHIGLMRRYAAQGDRRLALRQFERMDNALRRELGVGPPAAAVALRDQLLAASDVAPSEPARMQRTAADPDGPEQLVGRAAQTARVEGILATGAAGAGHVAFVHGPAGVGKTALLHWAEHRARALSWHTGMGAAAEIEGAWPYAPVVEALSDLCRRHPEILEELDDRFRAEIDRVLSGRVLDWNGEGAHQQLFVAAVELLRLASTTTPVLLVVDDVHEADQASLRLLHYLARSTGDLPVVLLLGHRSEALSNELAGVRDSLLSRAAAMDVILGPLDAESATTLVRQIMAANAADDEIEEVAALSRGFPFVATGFAQAAVRGSLWTDVSGAVLRGLPAATRGTLEQVALVGATFSTDEFLDLAATDTDRAYADLDAALSARVLERTEGGYRFRHPLVRDALVAALTPQQARAAHRHAADRLAAKGGSPARIGYHLMNAGESAKAVPYVTRAAQTAAAMGAYGDALGLVESIRAHVHGPDEALVLRIRADLLVALGDAGAIPAYRQALAVTNGEDQRLVRAKLARAAVIAGDLDLAVTALDGLEPDGGPADGPLLVAIGMSAYFAGDINRADAAAGEARRRVLDGDMSQHLLDLLTLQGLIAHNRGEWFDRLRLELRTTQDNAELAVAVFDSHLCVAEYLLYGPTPYEEVVAMAEALRATGRRTGALRAVAFAAALTGEAALLSGDLERAGQELREAADLHHDIGAPAGEALSLQRLAEVRLAQGDRTEANRLLQRALILARWSPMAPHLLQRTFGTMIEAAPDAEAALAMVDRAEGALADRDLCPFCDVMLAVPAAIACSRAGDIERAHRYLRAAEGCAARWVGTAWEAAVLEARGHLAWAEGDTRRAAALMAHATEQFEAAEQPRDAGRCRQTLKTMTASAAESDQ